MPVLEFDELDQSNRHPATGELLKNYWGYSPLSFFAPKASYAARAGQQVREFKEMVKALHRAGIEAILDVASTHTCEVNHTDQPSASAPRTRPSTTCPTRRAVITTFPGAATP